MIKKTIKYVDLEGDEFEEDFFFNLTKSEVAELEVSEEGGMILVIEKLGKTNDPRKVFEILKRLVHMSYGEKSPDKKRFIKSEELSKAFSETDAYDQLFMELISDSDACAAFIEGILPKIPDEAKKQPAQKR